MEACTFCQVPGDWQKVTNLNVIQLICSESDLDFDTTFGFIDNLKSSPRKLAIPLCPGCLRLFGDLDKIARQMRNLRTRLENTLSQISHNIDYPPPSAINGPIGRTAWTLRNIILHSTGKSKADTVTTTSTEVFPIIKSVTSRPRIPLPIPITPGGIKTEEGINPKNEMVFETQDYEMEESDESEEFEEITEDPLRLDSVFDGGSNSVPTSTQIGQRVLCSQEFSQLAILAPKGPSILRKKRQFFDCKLCYRTTELFESLQSLQKHVREMHTLTTGDLPCPFANCRRQLGNDILFQNHLQFHADEISKPFACFECDIRFSTKSNYAQHIKAHHQKPQSSPTYRFRCRFCARSESLATQIREHELAAHPKDLLHGCMVCGQTYSFRSILETHMTIHQAKKQYRCLICQAKFQLGTEMEDHLITCHVPKDVDISQIYQGPSNKMTIPTVSKLMKTAVPTMQTIAKAVMLEQTQPPPTLKRRTAVRRHKCYFCSNAFLTPWALYRHTATHTKERHFPCHLCPRTYNQISTLTGHLKSVHKTQPDSLGGND